MIWFAGLMGMLAVGATALVGFEMATQTDSDHEDDDFADEAAVAETDVDGGDDLIAMAAGLTEVAPVIEEHVTTDPDDSLHPLACQDEPAEDEAETVMASQAADPDAGAEAEEAEAVLDDAVNGPGDITEFSPEDDRLIIVFDDYADPDPTVGLEEDEDDLSRTHVTLNGVRIAAVDEAQGLTLDHIGLMPQSYVEGGAEA